MNTYFKIGLVLLIFAFSCNDCMKIDCGNNEIFLQIRDSLGKNLIGQNLPNVQPSIYTLDNNGSKLFLSLKVTDAGVVFTQVDMKVMVELLGVTDTISLINPSIRKTECCTLPLSDSILINGTNIQLAQAAIIVRN